MDLLEAKEEFRVERVKVGQERAGGRGGAGGGRAGMGAGAARTRFRGSGAAYTRRWVAGQGGDGRACRRRPPRGGAPPPKPRPAAFLSFTGIPDVNDLNVLDRFMHAFITYIAAGFGLLGGAVRFLPVNQIGIARCSGRTLQYV